MIRRKGYSYKTEKSYVAWVKRFILYHNKQHPRDMGCSEIEQLLTHLAVDLHVAASTQNQALQAILFLYREVFQRPIDDELDYLQCETPRTVANRPFSPMSRRNYVIRSRLDEAQR